MLKTERGNVPMHRRFSNWMFMPLMALALPACSASRAADVVQLNPQQPLVLAQATTPTKTSRALESYRTSNHFKAAAANPGRILGAGANTLSLFKAEREAIEDCTRRSDYQGECETVQVGDQRLVGLNDVQKDRNRWAYMRQVHQAFQQAMPISQSIPAKVLMPGSRVADALFSISRGYGNGGFVMLQMPGYDCTGTMDPIEPEQEEEETNPIGIMEFACQSGQILRGGYAFMNPQNQLFFIEDKENERWDFVMSSKLNTVGNSVTAFKKLFHEIEDM